MALSGSLPRLLLFLWLIILTVFSVQAQRVIFDADISRGKTGPGGEIIRILEGNVHVIQDTLEIFCDRATHYPARQRTVLTGNVKLIRGVETLTARQVTYYDRRKMAIAVDKVHLTRPGQEMRAEYLEYYYDSDRAFARTGLILTDHESRVVVTAGQGRFIPEENRSIVKNDAHFRQINESGSDTLHIFADEMEYRFGRERMAIGRKSVKILQTGLVATCDSAVYLLDSSRAVLDIDPIATQEKNRLSGKRIEMYFVENDLRRIFVDGQALATSVEDSAANKINRLSGQTITAFISAKKLRELWAVSNARSTYYLADKGVDQGVNTASADTIQIYFKAGDLNSIAVKSGSQGIFYPDSYKGRIETEDNPSNQ